VSPEALAAERLARAFGLTYLSTDGYEKLAALLAWVMPTRWAAPPEKGLDDILKPPPSRIG